MDVASKSYGYFNALSWEIDAISIQSYHKSDFLDEERSVFNASFCKPF